MEKLHEYRHFQYDMVKRKRQIGSTLNPLFMQQQSIKLSPCNFPESVCVEK